MNRTSAWPLAVVSLGLVATGWLLRDWIDHRTEALLPQMAAQPPSPPESAGLLEVAPEVALETEAIPRQEASVEPATPAVERQRWARSLASYEGGGRFPGLIMQEYWGGDWEAGGFGGPFKLDGTTGGWDGYLGDPAACIEQELPRLILENFKDQSQMVSYTLFPFGVTATGDFEGTLADLIRQGPRGPWGPRNVSKVDKQSPEYRDLLELVETEFYVVNDLAGPLQELQRQAIEADIQGLDAYTLPRRGYLNFGPIAIPPSAAFKAREIPEPRRLWSLSFPLMGTNMTRECRAWNGFYSVVWSDFPEVSGLLEQIIAHAAALEPIFAERLRALPYLP
jgi:hypothetical protein